MKGLPDLTAEQAESVRAILCDAAPRPSRVWVFGSRAKGRARRFSDLDLAIEAKRALSLSELTVLQEGFVESGLPWRVDVIDVGAVSEAFRALIMAEAILFAELPLAPSTTFGGPPPPLRG